MQKKTLSVSRHKESVEGIVKKICDKDCENEF